ncbi:MAG TPA: DUF4382 domain-containing protein [Chitinophagaceae bacterium]|nr:DUF4382 domain-containing protein [Chitinophagaceae bacterium]
MTTSKVLRMLALPLAITLLLYACSKDSSIQQAVPPGQQKVSIFLTDDPAFFDQVLVDIQSVAVQVDTCEKRDRWNDDEDEDHHHQERMDTCRIWDSLDIRPGVYDLLSLRNGVDTLLASGTIPDGKIKKIRIRLGPNNSLVKDSVSYPLRLPPGFDSVITINLFGGEWEDHGPRHRRLWMDFDLGRSIVRVRDNMFYLRPFFRLFIMSSTGDIAGQVAPREAKVVISVYNATDTAYALPNRDGRFKIWGLKEGTYDMFINASNGYQDSTVTGIEVKAGQSTRLDKIELHK